MFDQMAILARRTKERRPIQYWTANEYPSGKEIDRHESKAILTARNGHVGVIYKSIR